MKTGKKVTLQQTTSAAFAVQKELFKVGLWYRLRSAPTEIFKTFRGCLCKKDIDKYKVYVTLLPQQLVHCRRLCFAASGQY
jgi:hypothetical protein